MLLRRITQHVKAQNWFAVGLDFLIVVIGVFVGLQVNNWNEVRAERADEHAALERLFLEAQNAYGAISVRLERTQRINKIRRNAIAFVDGDAPLPGNTLPIKIGINTMAQFPPLGVVSVAYDELKSSGQMQLIRSAEIRDTISAFHADMEYLNLLQNGFRNSDGDFWDGYKRYVTWRYNSEATDSDIILSTYDWGAMRQDREFITTTIGLLRNQIVIENFMIANHEKARTMCDALGDAIERRCVEGEAAP